MNFRSLDRSLRIRIGVGFMNRLMDSMITSFMAIYLAFNYNVALAGAMMFVVVSLGVIGMLVGGHVSDTRGRRSTLLVAELVTFATFAAMAAANSAWLASPLLVYLAYLVNKFAASVALPANDAMIVDITTPEIRKGVYTINFWATNLALAIGALLGAALYDGHFTLMLLIATVGALGVAVSTFLWIPETRPEQAVTEPKASVLREFVAGYRLVLRDGTFIRLMVAGTLILAIEFQLINYIGVRLATELPEQQLLALGTWTLRVDGTEMLGILRAENTTLVVVLALFSHVLFRRIPDQVGLYLGTGLFVAGYMVLAVSNSGWVLMAAGLVFTIGELMSVPIRQTLLANMVPDHSRTRYMAVYNLNIRVAQMIAALCITLGSYLPSWGMAALYGVLGAVILWQYRVVLSRVGDPTRPTEAAKA